MPYAHVPGLAKTALLSLCLAVAGTFSAAALDYNDVKNLLAHQVSESVIISMVQENPAIPLSSGQLAELRGMGASETLISAIFTAPPATTTYVDPNTVYYESSTPVVVEPAPTVVYQTPTYVYPYPPVRYYYPRRPTFGFSLNFGGGHGGRRHGYHGRRYGHHW